MAVVNAGWRAATVFAALAGRAAAAGTGAVPVTIGPLNAPAGAAQEVIPIAITDRPRLPLRAAEGQKEAACDLADPRVLIGMASLAAGRASSAVADRSALEGWLDVLPGEWSVAVQRDGFD